MFDALDDGKFNPFCVFTQSISKQVEMAGEWPGGRELRRGRGSEAHVPPTDFLLGTVCSVTALVSVPSNALFFLVMKE